MTQFLSAGGTGGEEGEHRNIQRFALTPHLPPSHTSSNKLTASERRLSEAKFVMKSVLRLNRKRNLTFTLTRHLEHFGPGVRYCCVYYTRFVRSIVLTHLINPLTYLRELAFFTPGRLSTLSL